jgi:hypothetical protein
VRRSSGSIHKPSVLGRERSSFKALPEEGVPEAELVDAGNQIGDGSSEFRTGKTSPKSILKKRSSFNSVSSSSSGGSGSPTASAHILGTIRRSIDGSVAADEGVVVPVGTPPRSSPLMAGQDIASVDLTVASSAIGLSHSIEKSLPRSRSNSTSSRRPSKTGGAIRASESSLRRQSSFDQYHGIIIGPNGVFQNVGSDGVVSSLKSQGSRSSMSSSKSGSSTPPNPIAEAEL